MYGVSWPGFRKKKEEDAEEEEEEAGLPKPCFLVSSCRFMDADLAPGGASKGSPQTPAVYSPQQRDANRRRALLVLHLRPRRRHGII